MRGETDAAELVYQSVYQADPQTAELFALWDTLDDAARADVLAKARGLTRRGLAGQRVVD